MDTASVSTSSDTALINRLEARVTAQRKELTRLNGAIKMLARAVQAISINVNGRSQTT
jgi:hypothetical protein